MDTQALQALEGQSIAAVDLGSNSFHMVVARVSEGEVTRLDRHKEMVRLGAGLDHHRQLTQESRERALACLERFGQLLREIDPQNLRAVGTNTLRLAHNSKHFRQEAEEALGHTIEVISGIEEARLIYLGVARTLASEAQRRLVVDIGGGSTELIIGEHSRPRALESLYMGCVSSTLRHFADGRITKRSWRRATLAARLELEPVKARFRRLGWEQAVGSSGTIRAVRRVVCAAGWSDSTITSESLDQLRDRLLDIGSIDQVELEGVSVDRRPVFVGGAAIVTALLGALEIESLDVADGALREGVLYDLIGRWRHEDTRSRSASWLAERYHVDEEQAERVEATALGLLSQVAAPWELEGPDPRRALQWGARLHEIGMDVAHSHYHKHGAYIVANSDLAGFSLGDQELVAALVRAHRRKVPVQDLQSRPLSWLRLAVLLRLASLLHRSRSSEPPPALELKVAKKKLRLRLPADWLERNPLTLADLQKEAVDLAAAGVELRVHQPT